MAQITDKAAAAAGGRGTDSSAGWFFLGCFGGINNKGSVEKGEKEVGIKEEKKKTRSSVCFSWSKLKKRSYPRKTVPLDYGDNKVHSRKGSIFHMKSGKKQLKAQIPGSDIQKIVHDDQPNQTKYDNGQEIILDNSKSKNHLDSSKKPTCKKVLSGTLLRSNTTSPEDKSEVLSRGKVAGPQLSHSVSLPPPQPPRKKKKPVTNNIIGGNSKVNNYNTKEETDDKKKIDQLVGITLIMVTLTLIVMIFCGKICAILCTCGWFYFYPIIIVVSREKNEPNQEIIIGSKSAGEEEVDFNSPEYKKKVILEGFLERSHRIYS